MTPQRVLVLGASGYIGQNLIPHLIEQGHQITAAARRIEWLQEQNWPQVNCLYVDLYRPDTLSAALWEIDTLYYLVHAMGDGDNFIEKERQAAENLRDALRNAGVKQVIFLGALQPNDDSSPHLAARRLTGEILRQSGVPVTEL
ncbi:NAD(P)H-binding protein, partial [Serratia marcescens]